MLALQMTKKVYYTVIKKQTNYQHLNCIKSLLQNVSCLNYEQKRVQVELQQHLFNREKRVTIERILKHNEEIRMFIKIKLTDLHFFIRYQLSKFVHFFYSLAFLLYMFCFMCHNSI